jgi:hypothetical protein
LTNLHRQNKALQQKPPIFAVVYIRGIKIAQTDIGAQTQDHQGIRVTTALPHSRSLSYQRQSKVDKSKLVVSVIIQGMKRKDRELIVEL